MPRLYQDVQDTCCRIQVNCIVSAMHNCVVVELVACLLLDYGYKGIQVNRDVNE